MPRESTETTAEQQQQAAPPQQQVAPRPQAARPPAREPQPYAGAPGDRPCFHCGQQSRGTCARCNLRVCQRCAEAHAAVHHFGVPMGEQWPPQQQQQAPPEAPQAAPKAPQAAPKAQPAAPKAPQPKAQPKAFAGGRWGPAQQRQRAAFSQAMGQTVCPACGHTGPVDTNGTNHIYLRAKCSGCGTLLGRQRLLA